MSSKPALEVPARKLFARNAIAPYVATVLVVIGLLTLFLTQTYRQTREAAESEALAQATLLAARFETTLRRVKTTTNLLANELGAGDWPPSKIVEETLESSPRFIALAENFPEIASILVFDAQGLVRFTSEPRPRSLSVGDRPFFQDARNAAAGGFLFTEVISRRVDGTPVIIGYQSIRAADGGFRGIVGIPLNLDYFADHFRQAIASDDEMVDIRRIEDGALVMRWPPAPGVVNVPQPEFPPLTGIRNGVDSGAARLVSTVDGIHRIAGYVRVKGFPFFVVSARAAPAVFGTWRTTAAYSISFGVLAMSAVGLVLWRYRKLAHAQAESEQHFRNLANTGSALIWTTDRDGQVNYFNEPVLRFTGRTMEQLLDAGAWLECLHPEDQARSVERLKATITSRQPFTNEFRVRRADGEYRWFQDEGNPRYDSDGQFIGYIGVAVDVSEAKKTTEELERHRANLEGLVRERTEELELAKDKAEAANIAKSAFLANMSHELRTPLNGILGLTYLLKRNITIPGNVERLQKVERAGKHLLGIINSVLELSKIDAGKLQMHEGPIELGSIISDVVAMVQDQADSKGLDLQAIQPQYHGPLLVGDGTLLRQALLNYVNNAVKFTQHGCVIIRSSVDEQAMDHAWVRFEVKDTGPGIAPEELPRLFSAFEQLDNSSTRQHGGTGLGLAIARRLAQLMGGEAGVDSTLGEGSTFWFSAKLKKLPQADPIDGYLPRRSWKQTHLCSREWTRVVRSGWGAGVSVFARG